MHLGIELPPADTWLTFAGRLHPIAVHFPIALLISGALLELLSRRTDTRPSPAALACTVLGALGAVASAATGWIWVAQEPLGRSVQTTLAWHRWVGVATAALGLLALVAGAVARWRPWFAVSRLYVLSLAGAAIAAAWAGHLGATFVWGSDHLTEPFTEPLREGSAPAAALPALPASPGGSAPRASAAEGPAGASGPGIGGAATEPPPASPDSAAAAASVAAPVDFTRQVWPILAGSCVDCHGPRKHKGDLRLDQSRDAFDASRDPRIVVRGDPAASELLRRVGLPPDDPDAMPARGDPLTAAQVALLRHWIEQGAMWPELSPVAAADAVPPLDVSAREPAAPEPASGRAASDPVRGNREAGGAAAERRAAPTPAGPAGQPATAPPTSPSTAPSGGAGGTQDAQAKGGAEGRHAADSASEPADPFGFAPLPPEVEEPALAALRELGGRAGRVARSTAALEVDLSRTALTPADLAALDPLRPNLVWLDLGSTGLGDDAMERVAACGELRKLDLSHTAVGNAGLAQLARLSRLEVLNLVGTAVGDEGLDALGRMPSLRRVYLWGSAATEAGVAALRSVRPDLDVSHGD